MSASNTIIDLFARHKVASNLVMVMMILSGLWAANAINTQLDPSVVVPTVNIQATWPGASAEDVEQLIVVPIEQQLANLVELQGLFSTSQNGSASVRLAFDYNSDMSGSLDIVKNRVAQIRNFPVDMEPIVIAQATDYEGIAVVSVSAAVTRLQAQ
ncbi:MAG: efflux RND transporter permease subunit [Gammaproteobacteria bacterium]|jgi:multidrug efflux pump subunit AcrB|nr:efflux RND transporter permease subunit [Gammaproteobacteria bacterium]MDP7455971.1 efflux RND transporter permease subunit [Gammaproteobacteria bacterium]HJO11367.1 efflux RND transporter permease subunit [Gammaproteobacteria bacterium]